MLLLATGASLLAMTILSALNAPILDCDEVFNYYEPLHFLLYGKGFQTWEYTTEFTLRSWFYINLYAFLPVERKVYFYALRIIIGIFNAVTVIYLINQVDRFINRKTAVLTMVFTVYSTGYFIASTAFLPSSFGMGFITLAFAKSLEKTSYFNIAFIIASVTIAGVVGWPFCLAYGGIYVVQGICTNFRFLTLKRFLFMVVFSIICVLLTGIPMVLVDSSYYEKTVFTPLNLLYYNIFSSKGPDLFGTEPWTLNFNLAFIITLFSPLFIPKAPSLIPFFIWFLIFTLQPHKEERFLFVIYPILGYTSARTLTLLPLQKLIPLIMTGFMVLSSLRILALSTFYNTFKLYNHLPNEGLVCVNPWHLFPSHFHVPDQTQIGFYEGGGLLPSLFESFVGIPEGNNDGNEYVQSRLVKKEECEYVIDMYKAQIKDSYEIVNCEDYLDRTQTGISRYFYLGPKTWIKYCLFKRKS